MMPPMMATADQVSFVFAPFMIHSARLCCGIFGPADPGKLMTHAFDVEWVGDRL